MTNAGRFAKGALFDGLDPMYVEKLISACRGRTYQRGQIIFEQDEPGSELFLIVSGEVRITIVAEDGREHDLALLRAGDCFGEMSLIDRGPRSATAMSTALTETLVLGREPFIEIVEGNSSIMRHILLLLSRRLRVTDQLLADLLFRRVEDRVARHLAHLAVVQGEVRENGISVAVSQDEIARMSGTTRETVNRALRRYEELGILQTSRRAITITDARALASYR